MPALSELARLRAVLALGREIAGEHDPERLCARVLDACFRLFQADRGGITIYEPSSMAPLVSVARDRAGTGFALATTTLGRRVDIREPQLQTEVDGDGIYGRTASVRSVIAVPLGFETADHHRWHGMLVLDANALTQPFSRADLDLLETLAQPVALALENTMLIRQVQSVIGDEWRRLDRVVRDLPLGIVVLDDRRRCMLVNRWAAERPNDLGGLPAGLPIETIAGIPCADLVGRDRCTTTTTATDHILSLSTNTLTDGRETVIVIVDLTEERERQAQAAHRDRVALVGQLAGGVAHDFNNLLHVILTYTSMLQDSLQDPDQRDDLAQISHAATSAAELTRQLLAFSRRDQVKPKVVDVTSVVHNLEKSLRRTVGPQIELTINIGTRVPRVLIDSAQLDQILMNLIVNARDAMPTKIMLAVREVEVDAVWAAERNVPPGRYAGIEVSDTGSGIAPDVIARIFEPYFTTKARGKGSGLGLATVHGIVQQAKGDIHVDSQVGHGTTFHILLPATDQQTETRPIPTTASVGGATILVVDDDDHVRRATERILRAAGYAVLSASSGHNAMAFAREHHGAIDLLLTDVVMPGMSGRDLAREILALGATDRVVFMSGYHQTGPMGSAQFISKPFQRVDLIEKVRAVLGAAPEPPLA